MTLPLHGRVALITGVSRQQGIGGALARRCHALGATVYATGWRPHDAEMPWGDTPLSELPFAVHSHDLEQPEAPEELIRHVVDTHGRLDIVVATHARSSDGGLAEVTARELDRCWAANVRSVLLLAQGFARVHRPSLDGPPPGRMLWFTSGQHHQPMHNELAYAVTKGALHQMTQSLAAALSEVGIVANCINPGPVDTGYATGDFHETVASRFPDGRWGTPDDIANVVAFLLSDEGNWIRGQVLDAEGGFNRTS